MNRQALTDMLSAFCAATVLPLNNHKADALPVSAAICQSAAYPVGRVLAGLHLTSMLVPAWARTERLCSLVPRVLPRLTLKALAAAVASKGERRNPHRVSRANVDWRSSVFLWRASDGVQDANARLAGTASRAMLSASGAVARKAEFFAALLAGQRYPFRARVHPLAVSRSVAGSAAKLPPVCSAKRAHPEWLAATGACELWHGQSIPQFAGAGTTLLVADRLQRHGIGIELNPEYIAIAQDRLRGDAPLFAEVA